MGCPYLRYTTRRHTPQESILCSHRYENSVSHIMCHLLGKGVKSSSCPCGRHESIQGEKRYRSTHS